LIRGGLVLGLPLSIAGYFISYKMVTRYRGKIVDGLSGTNKALPLKSKNPGKRKCLKIIYK